MFIVFTDVDGTLLDHDTFSYRSAEEGLALLRGSGIPLVLVSSKTLPELTKLHSELSLTSPIIFENGGGIYWTGEAEREPIEYTGMTVSQLVEYVPLLRKVLPGEVRLLTDMTLDEAAGVSGLPPESARLSRQRTASLPFIFTNGRKIGGDELRSINGFLHPLGLAVAKGGRFYYFLSNSSDKGKAVKKIIEYYGQKHQCAIRTIGIGDSENDIPMFRAVDIPVVVKKNDGTTLVTGLPDIKVADGIGPAGFTEAVKSIIMVKT
jgi:mannosyl-3-phosphoglycerate phosphatase